MEVRVMSLYLLHYLYNYLPIHQNPFLCLFVDIYNVALLDESLKSEQFVTSVILNDKGEEFAEKTPSELIALSQVTKPRAVNLGYLDEFLPEVPIEDQVGRGIGWCSQKRHMDKLSIVTVFSGTLEMQAAGQKQEDVRKGLLGSRHGDGCGESDAVLLPVSLTDTLNGGPGHHVNGAPEKQRSTNEKGDAEAKAPSVSTNGYGAALTKEDTSAQDANDGDDDELEEWEIEAERRFLDSDNDEAPSLPAPKTPSSTTVPVPLSSGLAPTSAAAAVVAVAAAAKAKSKAAAAAAAAAAGAGATTATTTAIATASVTVSIGNGQGASSAESMRRKKLNSAMEPMATTLAAAGAQHHLPAHYHFQQQQLLHIQMQGPMGKMGQLSPVSPVSQAAAAVATATATAAVGAGAAQPEQKQSRSPGGDQDSKRRRKTWQRK
ncbi:hypothetical protein BGW38_005773 [Lunasporangiospora selenospora]|uniref:Uncharacterized protein n=1 Tax=Lunasporangiospora selenospora TaxID=979761 RepID=A0A9P6FN00_9FUNG|nr:hypothetical protein BGW38_005773 [Lunasporangiospora selenospora]